MPEPATAAALHDALHRILDRLGVKPTDATSPELITAALHWLDESPAAGGSAERLLLTKAFSGATNKFGTDVVCLAPGQTVVVDSEAELAVLRSLFATTP